MTSLSSSYRSLMMMMRPRRLIISARSCNGLARLVTWPALRASSRLHISLTWAGDPAGGMCRRISWSNATRPTTSCCRAIR